MSDQIDISPEAVEAIADVVEKWPSTTARDTLRALSARLAKVEKERAMWQNRSNGHLDTARRLMYRAERAEAALAAARRDEQSKHVTAMCDAVRRGDIVAACDALDKFDAAIRALKDQTP